jgi:hypothetical protein
MISNLIWLYWEQGWDQAPRICQYAYESFRENNPECNVICLEKKNLFEYIDYETNKWILDVKTAAARSDCVRIAILSRYGGFYADAATLCHLNLPNFVKDNCINSLWMYSLHYFKKCDRKAASWFIISPKGDSVSLKLYEELKDYLIRNPNNYPYFIFHYTYNKVSHNMDHHIQPKLHGFMNRIDASILHLPLQKITLTFDHSFHPHDLDSRIQEKRFGPVIKLRHKNLNPNFDADTNTLFMKLYSMCLSKNQ